MSVEIERVVMLPEHPCWVGDGAYDHNWEFQDESFDHEYGTEIVHYFCCPECGATRDMESDDYVDPSDYYFEEPEPGI